jgi:hypothetical protein
MTQDGNWEVAEWLRHGLWRRFDGGTSRFTDKYWDEINKARLIAPDECTVLTEEDMEYGQKLAIQNEYDPFCEPLPDKLPRFQETIDEYNARIAQVLDRAIQRQMGYTDPHPEHQMD